MLPISQCVLLNRIFPLKITLISFYIFFIAIISSSTFIIDLKSIFVRSEIHLVSRRHKILFAKQCDYIQTSSSPKFQGINGSVKKVAQASKSTLNNTKEIELLPIVESHPESRYSHGKESFFALSAVK